MLLSGDRHISEISRVEDPALRYPLYEVTSSGLTHSWLDNPGEVNRHRVGELFTDLSYGLLEVDWANGELGLQILDRAGDVVPDRFPIPRDECIARELAVPCGL